MKEKPKGIGKMKRMRFQPVETHLNVFEIKSKIIFFNIYLAFLKTGGSANLEI